MGILKNFEQFWDEGVQANFSRFYWVFLSALTAIVCSWMLMEYNSDVIYDTAIVGKILAVSLLGIPLFYAIRLFIETHPKFQKYFIPASLLGAGLLVAYYFTIPADIDRLPMFHGFRYFAIALGLHAIVSFSVFYRFEDIQSFWQFNTQQFLRFVIGIFYSVVLMAGISLAFLAFDFLLDIKIREVNYGRLAILLFIGFHTLFFLAGNHTRPGPDFGTTNYPKGLSIFSRFILIPLVLLYLFILYAYVVKIAMAWSLPNGYVSLMVMCYSVLGILAYLFVFPLRNESGQGWIQQFIKWFFVFLIPLLGVLFIAIGTRISDYGWTEERYTVAVLGFWLLLIALYFLISKRDNIIIIPMSLAILSVISVIGPWSMFSVSRNSQLDQMRALLEPKQLMKNGELVLVSDSLARNLPDSTYNRVYSIVNYLGDHHGWELFTDKMDTVRYRTIFGESDYVSASQVLQYYGLERVDNYKPDLQVNIQVTESYDRPLDVEGWKKLNHFYAYKAERFDEGNKDLRIWNDTLYTKEGLKFSLLDSLEIWKTKNETQYSKFNMYLPEINKQGRLRLNQISVDENKHATSCDGVLLKN